MVVKRIYIVNLSLKFHNWNALCFKYWALLCFIVIYRIFNHYKIYSVAVTLLFSGLVMKSLWAEFKTKTQPSMWMGSASVHSGDGIGFGFFTSGCILLCHAEPALEGSQCKYSNFSYGARGRSAMHSWERLCMHSHLDSNHEEGKIEGTWSSCAFPEANS